MDSVVNLLGIQGVFFGLDAEYLMGIPDGAAVPVFAFCADPGCADLFLMEREGHTEG